MSATPSNGENPAAALAALERFVVDNDELLELEERIGRFNIFDALGVARTEIRHSNFLAWLLDPAESHGHGLLFLTAVLMDLLRQAPPGYRPLSPVELDGEDLRGVTVRREWRNIDLLITCDEPPFVIAIENKIDSGERRGQLSRYKKIVREHFPRRRSMFVFLTADATEPSDSDWLPYSYAHIHRVLRRVRNTNAPAIGDEVRTFLDHYLRLIGSRFMHDEQLDRLCRHIYKNHHQALRVLVARTSKRAVRRRLLRHLEKMLFAHSGNWRVIRKATRGIDFLPSDWPDLFPPVGKHPKFDSRHWCKLRFTVSTKKRQLVFQAGVGSTTDAALRRRVIERLTETSNPFGLRLLKDGADWTRLGNEQVATWAKEELPDPEVVTAAAAEKLNELQKRLAGVPEALRPLIEDWQRAQAGRPRPGVRGAPSDGEHPHNETT